MRKNILVSVVLLAVVHLSAQQTKPQQNQKPATKKYQSLLWEITGNGLKKPSYLFGTMHVSDKLAFHLGDSFYTALKAVQVVALETNPENWQEHFSTSSLYKNQNRENRNSNVWPNDRMNLATFSIDNYEQAVKAAMAVEPSMVNGLLYRTYGTRLDDFEEDQYLDLYIFQAGKKLGKRLTEVENFEESEKLVKEAYRDMLKDRHKKKRSFDFEDRYTNPKKVEDAYRNGDLDMMDSLQALNVNSDAFEEKFLYRRNEIQAKSIDTILKKASLFVAVGAAHLPGKRGVIEMLRNMGYTLRPVKMDDRNSTQKEIIDGMRYTTHFLAQSSDDHTYQVSIPGKKFYHFTDWNGMDVVQYADMVNGAYYMVTRVKTNSLFRGQTPELTWEKIDSFLYENIPGKILRKNPVTRNGYKGWEILNRTRRGDHQRYQIFITPFEILFFKMSGNGDYITRGKEAEQFFGSIKLKEYRPGEWTKFQPPTGGFCVQLPHSPSLLKEKNFGADRLEYGAFDKNSNSYLVIQASLHNYSYAEEDSFELNLMNDSYAHSSFIDDQLLKKFSLTNGYPTLDAKFLHKDGSYSSVKFIIRGPIYYVVAAHHQKDDENIKKFLTSFNITPIIYPGIKQWTDTAMRFTVQSPLFSDTSIKADDDDDDYRSLSRLYYNEDAARDEERYKSVVIGNDTLGEKIYVSYSAPSRYRYWKDTLKFWKSLGDYEDPDSSFIYKVDKTTILADGTRCRELQLTDTASSKLILSRSYYKKGYVFSLTALTDTLSPRSSFLQSFFSTFTPADTLKEKSLFTRKTELFFDDLFSTDSLAAKRAFTQMNNVRFDLLDVPLLKKAIERLNWKSRDYVETKKSFIDELGWLKDSSITPFLKQLYVKAKDTSAFQNAILVALLQQKTKLSFEAFKDMLLQEPPISDDDEYNYSYYRPSNKIRTYQSGRKRVYDADEDEYSGPWWQLYDTMALTKQIFPQLLPMMNVTDYEDRIKDLLTTLVDSGYIKGSDYETQFSKIYLDAKQLLKKQITSEEVENMKRLNKKEKLPYLNYYYSDDEDDDVLDEGNEALNQYATLLMPFYEKNPGVVSFFDQLLKTKDRGLLYDVFVLMLRNNKPVPDSLFENYARLDDYRFRLYKDLKKIKKTEKFPAAYLSQQQIARSILISEFYKPDTLVYLEKLPVVYKNKKGVVHFYKYKAQRDDTYWQLACVGIQPENENEIDVENDDFTASGDFKINATKPLKEQIERALREMLYSKRESALGFYNTRNYNLYKTYLPDIVKSSRYRD